MSVQTFSSWFPRSLMYAAHDILMTCISPVRLCLQYARKTSLFQLSVGPKRTLLTAPSIASRMPADAWDCHMHVTDPEYPLAVNAAYTPAKHSLDHAMKFERSISVSNIVLVQPSIYGNDNSCLLDALKDIGPRHGRAVVGVDPDTIDSSTLKKWHSMGVRGVRLNLKSVNAAFTEQSLKETIQKYANIVKPLDWVLEVFIDMHALPMLEQLIPQLGIKFCIAHFGTPQLPSPTEVSCYPLNPYKLEGFQSLVNLLASGKTWLKLSAAYRVDSDPKMRGVQSLATELLRVAPDRLVFASDWPHTRFEGFDVKPFVESCLDWTENAGLTEKVFALNAKELWDVQ